MRRSDLQAEAVLAAEYVLADIDHPPGTRVDVYRVIEARDVWLSFDPYEDVLGHYQRQGHAAGISINARRPPPLQRFTAAHELGHHELGHDFSFDNEEDITGRVRDPLETQAQVFAANLLMSEVSVEAALEMWNLDPIVPDLDAVAAYVLSAQLGVSYKAMLMQLVMLEKLGWAAYRSLTKSSPLQIKRQLLQSYPLEDHRRTVVHATLAQNQTTLVVGPTDLISVELPQTRRASTEWVVPARTTSMFSLLADHSSDPEDQPSLFQSSGSRTFLFSPKHASGGRLAVQLSDDSGSTAPSVAFVVDIVVEQHIMSDVGSGLSVFQQAQILGTASQAGDKS